MKEFLEKPVCPASLSLSFVAATEKFPPALMQHDDKKSVDFKEEQL
jgi:hypothetical protein